MTDSFAPVLIPTLCRYDHFKNCIESLKKCSGVENTEVYIGLDYPASPKHWDGYNKISEYLETLKEQHPFKKLHVIKRERNYGVGVNGNFDHLRDEVFKTHDRIIVSEDDNIFSPAFLDYINKGLEKYKDDKSVIGICGYRHYYDILKSDNNIYRQNVDFSAWGYGMWKDRYEELISKDYKWYQKQLTPKKVWNVARRNGKNRALQFVGAALIKNKKYRISDNLISVYMALTGKDVIMPCVTCVKNNGIDGSGENFADTNISLQKKHMSQPLFKEQVFTISGDPYNYYKENNIIHVKESYGKINTFKLVKGIIKIMIKSLK